MSRDQLLEQLQYLLKQKKSRKFYAEKLGITEQEVRELLDELKTGKYTEAETAVYIADLEEKVVRFEEDLKNKTAELILHSKTEIRNLQELIEKTQIDTTKWEVSKYVQNYWGNSNQPHWQVKAWLSPKSEISTFQDNFKQFLSDYAPQSLFLSFEEEFESSKCLLLNKQDSHLNKYDIKGDNDIIDRLSLIESKVAKILQKATSTSLLDKIIYIIGSDEFNSEWTKTTTKGTEQQNILPYHIAFQLICQHEAKIINSIIHSAKEIEVVYIPGNHDEYVGWHMISWLQTYFRNNSSIKFDISPEYTKCVKYGNSAMMFNHGDAIKPQKLANMFPMEFKNEWSSCDNFYIFTGDKHVELSMDFNGIKFYQIPALSNAKSLWDSKNGYTCSKAEMTAFLIEKENGISDIYKEFL
jgi:UDP-2,3-diacylglucosamine pyrophosphatase LpxH